MSSLASSEFSSGGASSVSSISVRDCTTKIKTLQQENFDLRLRIFLLEEKLGKQSQTLKLQMKTEDNQRPVNVRRFFSYQRPQSYEGETERQLTSCRQSLQTCIELVLEATDTIEHLENKIEEERGEREDMEEQLVEAEAELSLQRLDTYKEEEFLTGSDLDEAQGKVNLRLGTEKNCCDSSTQCDMISQQRDTHNEEKRIMQVSYVDSVTVYRNIIEKLEEKLMLAEDHWKQFIVKLALFLEKINPNLEAEFNNFIDSLTLSKEELRDIFNTNSIFDNL